MLDNGMLKNLCFKFIKECSVFCLYIFFFSLGGNMLINVGPTAYGEIAPIYEERLRQIGSWLKVNGEAIYKTQIWSHQNDSQAENVWYVFYMLILKLYLKSISDQKAFDNVKRMASLKIKSQEQRGVCPRMCVSLMFETVGRLKALVKNKLHALKEISAEDIVADTAFTKAGTIVDSRVKKEIIKKNMTDT